MLSEELTRRVAQVAQDLAYRAISECGVMYGFDSSEAIRHLGLESVSVRRDSSRKASSSSLKKVLVVKPSFPLPYNGECDAECCQALRQNNGLYTQCQSKRKVENAFCKACLQWAAKSEDGIPEYGTISQRKLVGPFEYVDPKGRRPVAYTKVMKKYKVSEEQVLAEAGKFNMNILAEHFVSPASESKRGRPKKAVSVPKEPKGSKGRPKKTKKVLEIDGGDEEDLFVTMVAAAAPTMSKAIISSSESDNDSANGEQITKVSSEEKEAKKAAKALKKQQEEEAKAAKVLKKQQEEESKALKKQQEEEANAAKALKKQQEEEAKALKKQQEEEAKVAKPAEEQDSVKKIEFNGKKYLKSKLTGVIYDREIYEASGDIVQIGKWNEQKQMIDFIKQESDEEASSESEEEEEEYEEN
jgi:flagellar biosynthesis GTPase FlhF